ncbi:Ribosomal RNA small subunit methyltransferase D [Methylacidimicrobium cyclopophantes]|uniref:Ribosomal RNA small subunit methyltransferase D n=2 Tax=Methylacidimicrobium cyclopophantes TaxID=1041766 RepID=A0A5E6M908_9BACT|nr:Ribosomal RNA small subunit methyltransferase D [Methylacidimicrobium cyclopophantes]
MALRVISGVAGGLRLEVPRGVEIRPALDRVKGAIFSSLGDWIVDKRVLDLYAGTGALGIESLSRGAREATFVDLASPCCRAIRNNLFKTGLTGRVVEADALRFLQRDRQRYDLILASPPYEKRELLLDDHPLLSAVLPHLAPEGFFLWEFFRRNRLDHPVSWRVRWQRRAGETVVVLLEPAPGSWPSGTEPS